MIICPRSASLTIFLALAASLLAQTQFAPVAAAAGPLVAASETRVLTLSGNGNYLVRLLEKMERLLKA